MKIKKSRQTPVELHMSRYSELTWLNLQWQLVPDYLDMK